MDAGKAAAQLIFQCVQLAVKAVASLPGHAGQLPPVREEIKNIPNGDAVAHLAAAAEEEAVTVPAKDLQAAGEHFLQLLHPGRLHEIGQGADGVALKDPVGIGGDEHQLQALVSGSQLFCRLHAVGLAHFHIQKHQIQLPGVLFQPAQQP